MAIVGAALLNSTRSPNDSVRRRRNDTTRPSSATTMIAAHGPNSSAEVIVKLSAMEKLIGTIGMRSRAHALSAVMPTRMYQRRSTPV